MSSAMIGTRLRPQVRAKDTSVRHTLPPAQSVSRGLRARGLLAGAVLLTKQAQLPNSWACRPCRVRCAASSSSMASAPVTAINTDGPVLVWFKADLRVDDHEGLIAAADAVAKQNGQGRVLPLFVLDLEQLRYLAFIPSGPAVLCGVLRELRAALQSRGSDLVVVRGSWQEEVPRVARQYGAKSVVVQREVEHMLSSSADEVAQLLSSAGVSVHYWDTPTWDPAEFDYTFTTWRQSRPAPLPPRAAVDSLPPLPEGLDNRGVIPEAEGLTAELEQAVLQSLGPSPDPGVLEEVKGMFESAEHGPESEVERRLVESGRDWLQRLSLYLALSKSQPALSSKVEDPESKVVAEVLSQGVRERETPAAEGYSFPAMFSAALTLGALSRRRVYNAAAARAQASNNPSQDTDLQVRAAAQTAESGDFHWRMAALNSNRPPDPQPGVEQRHWRWNGFLTDYACVSPPPGKERPGAPAVLLLHGFGAMGDHWRDNLYPLAEAGYRVYAPTLPGFGRSEKVAVPYGPVLWSDFLRDFVVQVIGGPVVLAGNSIGGFIATNTAALHPGLVRGLVLVNSAGPITKEFDEAQWKKDSAERTPPPKWVVKLISQALFVYLQWTVSKTLAWLYPTAPQRTTGWLDTEIRRASGDIGALDVFASVFYLAPPRPLNYLINECYKGKVLVLQGVLDPLNDAKGRARSLAELCPSAEVVELMAGHCPHDEAPDKFNQELLAWMDRSVATLSGPTTSTTAPTANTASVSTRS